MDKKVERKMWGDVAIDPTDEVKRELENMSKIRYQIKSTEKDYIQLK